MAIRVRRSVWSLPDGDKTLDWYRQAVAKLLTLPPSSPSSWRYLAAIHGVPSGMSVPPGAGPFWDQCQHQSWFFLPWHRGYVASFEAVIAATIVGLGGPDEWALPYWDYSEDLAKNPNARLMPPALFDRLLPDGSRNALWSRRAQAVNGDFNLDDSVVTLDALQFENFANAQPGEPSGFGGPETGFNNSGGDSGGLENLPHNRVHVQIGGQDGFMSDPATAALDPIFWLHHCNIDRLWEVWRNQGAQFHNPAIPQWLTAVRFDMHDANGTPFTYSSSGMLDTTRVLHGYRYDNVPVAHDVQSFAAVEVAMAPKRPPELAGANAGPLSLEGDVTHTEIALAPQSTSLSFSEAAKPTPEHVYLNLENITGIGMPGDFKVYIDLPNDTEQPALAGVMTTFGLERASDPSRHHGGSGLNQVFEITALAGRLGLNRHTVSRLHVSFVREALPAAAEGFPEGLENYARSTRDAPTIRVGRVSLFYG